MSADSSSTLDLMTVSEAAEALKVSKSTLRRLQGKRKIPFYRVGGGIRFTKKDLASFVSRNRVEASAK